MLKDKLNVKTITAIVVLILVAATVSYIGYRVVVTSSEKPGKLSSISAAAVNLNYVKANMKQIQKVTYDNMKYGYMDEQMVSRMDYLDRYYENQRMEEIRQINNLTAMSEKTADKIAYEEFKTKQDEEKKKARQEYALAQTRKLERIQAIVDSITSETDNTGYADAGSDTGSGDTASRGGKKGKPVYASTHGESLGKFVITAYCTCKICCGIYSGHNRTASGTVPTSNRTIAVDTSVIPFKTKVVFNGQVYVAEDRGGAIVGKRIDLFFMTHKEALKWGRKTMEVFLAD